MSPSQPGLEVTPMQPSVASITSEIFSPMQDSPDFITQFAAPAFAPAAMQPLQNTNSASYEVTPQLTASQQASFSRASASSGNVEPYQHHGFPRTFGPAGFDGPVYGPATTHIDQDVMLGLAAALESQVIPFEQRAIALSHAGGDPSQAISPDKFQLKLECESLSYQLDGTQREAQRAIILTEERAQLALNQQKAELMSGFEVCADQAKASWQSQVTADAQRVNAGSQHALRDASLRLHTESKEVFTLRSEFSGRQVHNDLILQSEVNEVKMQSDQALSNQRQAFAQEQSQFLLHYQSEQAEAVRLRSEYHEHLSSFQHQAQVHFQTEQYLKIEKDKTAHTHTKLVDYETRLNAADLHSRALQSEVAEARHIIANDAHNAGSNPTQEQMRISIEQEYHAKIEQYNSQWEDAVYQERHTAVRNTQATFFPHKLRCFKKNYRGSTMKKDRSSSRSNSHFYGRIGAISS